jgi:hypothetical protein
LCPSSALKTPISHVLPKIHGLVVHLEHSSRYFIYLFNTTSSFLQ